MLMSKNQETFGYMLLVSVQIHMFSLIPEFGNHFDNSCYGNRQK